MAQNFVAPEGVAIFSPMFPVTEFRSLEVGAFAAGYGLMTMITPVFSVEQAALATIGFHNALADSGSTGRLEYHYPPAPEGQTWVLSGAAPVYWWTGRAAPIAAKAKNPCRLWRAPGDAAPYRTITDGRNLGITELRGGWGLVFRQAGYADIWVMAEDCTPA
jgi:hypothetical protein